MGFEPTISAGERTQTYAWDRAATGTGLGVMYRVKITPYVETTSVRPSVCDVVSAFVPFLHILFLYKSCRVGVSYMDIGWTVLLRVRM